MTYRNSFSFLNNFMAAVKRENFFEPIAARAHARLQGGCELSILKTREVLLQRVFREIHTYAMKIFCKCFHSIFKKKTVYFLGIQWEFYSIWKNQCLYVNKK